MKANNTENYNNMSNTVKELDFIAKLLLAFFGEFRYLRLFSIKDGTALRIFEYKYFENLDNYSILIGKNYNELFINNSVSLNECIKTYKECEYVIEIDRLPENLDGELIYNVLGKLEKIVRDKIYSPEEINNFYNFFFDEAKFELKTYETKKIKKTIDFFYNNLGLDILLLDNNKRLIYSIGDENRINDLNEISSEIISNDKKIYIEDLNLLYLPILYQGDIVGTLITFLKSGERSEFNKFSIDKLSKRLSKILTEIRESTLQKIQSENEIFDRLIFGGEDKYILSKYIKRNDYLNCAILRIKVIGVSDHFKLIGKDLEHIDQKIKSVLEKYNLKYLLKLEEDGLCICLISKNKLLNERYNNLLNIIMHEIKLELSDISISTGRVYNSFKYIKHSYFEAIEGINILESYYIHRSMINYRDIGILRFVLAQDEKLIQDYLFDVLQPIIEYDKKRNTELLKTLFYYCRHNKNVNYVSNKLHIHQNTLYQRVKKAEELMGYDINDPMDWIDIQAASILYGLLFTDYIKNL